MAPFGLFCSHPLVIQQIFTKFLISVRPCDGSQVNKSGYEWHSPCSQRGACILVAKTDIKDVDSQVVRFNSCYNLHYLNKKIET